MEKHLSLSAWCRTGTNTIEVNSFFIIISVRAKSSGRVCTESLHHRVLTIIILMSSSSPFPPNASPKVFTRSIAIKPIKQVKLPNLFTLGIITYHISKCRHLVIQKHQKYNIANTKTPSEIMVAMESLSHVADHWHTQMFWMFPDNVFSFEKSKILNMF